MTRSVDMEVESYLNEVSLFARALPPDRRAELLGELEMHLSDARKSGQMGDLRATRALLERLGDPQDLVHEALELDPPRHFPEPSLDPAEEVYRDLTLGSFWPPVARWGHGVLRVWRSPDWPRESKWVALLAFPGGPLVALVVSLWLWTRTAYSCGTGLFGTANSAGAPTGTAHVVARTCSTPAVYPSVAAVLTVVLLLASVIGPMFVRARYRHPR